MASTGVDCRQPPADVGSSQTFDEASEHALATLQRALRRSQGTFALFLVVGSQRALCVAAERLRRLASSQNGPELSFLAPPEHAQLIDRVARASGELPALKGLVVEGADALIEQGTPVYFLNVARDVLHRVVAGPLVLMVAPDSASALMDSAPDLVRCAKWQLRVAARG